MTRGEKAARAQLRDIADRLEKVETEKRMLLVLRAQRILDAERRGLHQHQIGELLGGMTKQRVGQIAKQARAEMLDALR